MKVKAQYHHVFEVTREVEVNEEDFAAWRDRRYGKGADNDLALTVWIEQQDTDWTAEVFHDWRSSEPLPSDFELQYSEVVDAYPVPLKGNP